MLAVSILPISQQGIFRVDSCHELSSLNKNCHHDGPSLVLGHTNICVTGKCQNMEDGPDSRHDCLKTSQDCLGPLVQTLPDSCCESLSRKTLLCSLLWPYSPPPTSTQYLAIISRPLSSHSRPLHINIQDLMNSIELWVLVPQSRQHVKRLCFPSSHHN